MNATIVIWYCLAIHPLQKLHNISLKKYENWFGSSLYHECTIEHLKLIGLLDQWIQFLHRKNNRNTIQKLKYANNKNNNIQNKNFNLYLYLKHITDTLLGHPLKLFLIRLLSLLLGQPLSLLLLLLDNLPHLLQQTLPLL